MKLLCVLIASACLLIGFNQPARAGDQFARGFLALETPIGTPDRVTDNASMMLGRLTFDNAVGPIGIFLGGQFQFRNHLPWSSENKCQVGLELPLAGGLTVYTFGERRYSTNDNRVVAGVRFNFDCR